MGSALLSSLDLGRAHIVGNSGGGATALWLAAERPEMLRSLAMHEPPLFGLLVDDPASATARHFVDTVAFGPVAWDNLPPARQATLVNNAPTFLDELQDPNIAIVDLEALSRFERPTLLSRGDRSPAFFSAVVGKIAEAMPSAENMIFAGASHTPHVSHPAEFVETITGFIHRSS